MGKVEWSPIHLLPGPGYSPKDITLTLAGQGWYFPSDRMTGGKDVRHFERCLEATLFVPLGNYPAQYSDATPTEGAFTRLKISYFSGANEANGFACSSGWTFGVEVQK
jgi:hypothetical protein